MNSNNIKSSEPGTVSVHAVGDVFIQREDPKSVHALCAQTLQEADIRYCHIEGCISDKGTLDPDGPPGGIRIPPEHVSGFTNAGFNVASFNGLQSTFWGADAFLDSISVLNRNGIQTVGGGKNIDEARKPAIIKRNGVRIAFLAYSTFMRPEFWAGKDNPGAVPMRAHTFYEPMIPLLPGWDARVHTCPVSEDLMAMRDDINKARLSADIVIISWHAGIPFVKAELAEYQREVCYAAIDAGADAIIGHFPHILKPIEVYKGRVIFYSLGNCPFEHSPKYIKEITEFQLNTAPARFGLKPNPDDPLLGYYPADARKSMIARILVTDKKISRVSFRPVVINKQNQPEVMKQGSQGFDEVFQYVKDSTMEAGIDTQFKVDGDEVLVLTDK